MHDYRTGLPKGTLGPMICLAHKEDTEVSKEDEQTTKAKTEIPTNDADNTINGVKGGKGFKGGKG